MTRDFFDPTAEQQNVVLIDASTLQKAQRMIAGCDLPRSLSITFSTAWRVPIRVWRITFWKCRPGCRCSGPRNR